MNPMSRTAAVYGLTVPPDDDPIECYDDDTIQGEIHVTMAAIDPTAAPASDAAPDSFKGATLKMIILPPDFDDDGSDDDDLDMDALLNGEASDDEDDSDDEDLNGGPSDPQRSPKALKQKKFLEELKKAREEEEDDEDEDEDDMDVDMLNGLSAKAKGKAREIELDEDDDDDSDEAIDLGEPKELVLCSLDLTKTYQQPLNITIPFGGRVFFKASGTHNVYLSGNISAPWDDKDSEDDEYDLSPDEDELDMPEDEDESDELDDIDDPRIQELDSDEEEVPKLMKGIEAKKGKNKRAADESEEETATGTNLDRTLAKAIKPEISTPMVNGDEKLTKKQRKKLKANGGNAVEVSTNSKDSAGEDLGVKEVASGVSKQNPGKQDKKVQFATKLVQGPSSSATTNGETSKSDPKTKTGELGSKPTNTGGSKPSLGVKTIQGVTVDDKKLGSGPQAKKGDRVSMRYIGKLEDKRVFDSNKKGPPFSFKIGSGEVIKGWDFGVSGMSAGGERRMTIPPALAYGSKALPGIPKNSTLVFDVKLLEIK